MIQKLIYVFILVSLMATETEAITASFSGSYGENSIESDTCYYLDEDDNVFSTLTADFIDGVHISENIDAKLSGGGGLSKYLEINDPGGVTHAATYASLTDSDGVSWDGDAYVKKGSAYAWEKISMTNGVNPLFGGFAWNIRGDYAATQMVGGTHVGFTAPVTMQYTNNMVATSTSASAKESFKGGSGDAICRTWAERGDLTNEYRGTYGGTYHIGPSGQNAYEQFSTSNFHFAGAKDATYKADATSGISGASSNQEIKSSALSYAYVEAVSGNGKYGSYDQVANVGWRGSSCTKTKYSSKSSINSKGSSTTGTLDVKTTNSAEKWSNAWDSGYSNYRALSDAYVASDPTKLITNSLSSKDNAKASGMYAYVDESITASGALVSRHSSWPGISAQYPGGYQVYTNVEVGNVASNTLSTLKGKSMAVSSTKDYAKISGSWQANAALGYKCFRRIQSTDGTTTSYTESSNPGAVAFKENAQAKPGFVYAV